MDGYKTWIVGWIKNKQMDDWMDRKKNEKIDGWFVGRITNI